MALPLLALNRFTLHILLCITALKLLTSPSHGQTRLTSRAEGEKKTLEKFVDGMVQPLIDSSQIAGMGVGVMRNDSILLLKSYGYADLEFDVALPTNASFEIGSLTKQFTAVAILQLAEKKLLHLDDPINQYLPLNFAAEKVTIRQLLTHTSGIKEVRLKDLIYHIYPRDTILKLVENEKLDFTPGSAMLYNNKGYFILGLLIEKVAGMSYEEYVTKNLFSFAGMKNSYLADLETIRKGRSHGYNNVSKDGKLTRAEQPYFYWTYSAGALASTVEDLLKWNQALHRTHRLLSKAMYQELLKVGQLNDGTLLRYAKGLQVFNYRGYRVIGHGGSGSGLLCDLRYFPEQNLTIVTLQNTYRRVSESAISFAIANKLLPIKKEPKETFRENLSSYKGTYKGVVDIQVDVVDAQLLIKRSWQTTADTLTYVGHGKWALGNALYSFKIENDQVKELHWDDVSAYFILKKYE